MSSSFWHKITKTIAPYRDIFVFVVVLLVSDGLWKLTCARYEHSFLWPTDELASIVYAIVSSLREGVSLLDGHRIVFASGTGTTIIWGCTAIKQAWIWLCLIAFARGPWKHKLWYIPAGWVLIMLINIVRISAIALIIEHHPEQFDLWHTYIFKYLFYGLMFLMWAGWSLAVGGSDQESK